MPRTGRSASDVADHGFGRGQRGRDQRAEGGRAVGGSRGRGGHDRNGAGNGSPPAGGPQKPDQPAARPLGNPNLSRNRRRGDFNPTANPSGVHPDEAEEGLLESLLGWLGFEQDVTVNPETRKRQSEITGFDPTDSGLIGGLLTLANPLLGAAYGVGTNLYHGRPVSAAASALTFGRAAPVGHVVKTGIGVADLFGLDVDDEVQGVIEGSAETGSTTELSGLAGQKKSTGNLTAPPERDGPSELYLARTNTARPDISAVSSNGSEGTSIGRYTQSQKLGVANIRRAQYRGQPLLGMIDELGYSA